MPGTSPSWATVRNGPCAVRQDTMREASTGPIPGNESSCSGVAVDREIALALAPPGGVTPTAICSPSINIRARLTVDCACGSVKPPAAATASATREPGCRCTSPGCMTLPMTCTTTLDWGGAPLDGVAVIAMAMPDESTVGAVISSRGRPVHHHHAATARTPARTSANARSEGGDQRGRSVVPSISTRVPSRTPSTSPRRWAASDPRCVHDRMHAR